MAKQSGLGDQIYVGGYDLSNDVGSVNRIAMPSGLLQVPGIDKSAQERVFGHKDGAIEFMPFFNDGAGQEHVALKDLNRDVDTQVMYLRGSTLGNPGACLLGRQMNYDASRPADGSWTWSVQALGNGYGLEWGQSLTAGKRTDTGATNGTGVDFVDASTAFGMAAYLQVFSFTGTDVTVRIQDSADNSSFANITGLGAFTAITGGAPLTERIETDNLTRTIRRYLRVITSTTGGFSSLVFAVVAVRYTGANRDT